MNLIGLTEFSAIKPFAMILRSADSLAGDKLYSIAGGTAEISLPILSFTSLILILISAIAFPNSVCKVSKSSLSNLQDISAQAIET